MDSRTFRVGHKKIAAVCMVGGTVVPVVMVLVTLYS